MISGGCFRRADLRESIVDHRQWEALLIRMLFSLVVLQSVQWGISYQPIDTGKANGLGKFIPTVIDLFSDTGLQNNLFIPVCAVALVCYVIGVYSHVSLGIAGLICIGMGTLENSQGWIGHTTQLVTLVVLTQSVVYWIRPRRFTDGKNERRAIHWAKVTIASAYVVSGLVKFLRSDGQWLWQSPWLALQFVKTGEQNFLNRLEEPAVDGLLDQLPALILEYPNIFRCIFGIGLLIELFCFLALVGRKSALGYGLLLILFHLSISITMRLDFTNHILLIGVFLVNIPWWICQLIRRQVSDNELGGSVG
jgi:hypothetical protein